MARSAVWGCVYTSKAVLNSLWAAVAGLLYVAIEGGWYEGGGWN